MTKPIFDKHSSIPMGQELRVLLNSEHISYGEIHALLKKKGIFIGDSDKSTTVPLLTAVLMTPEEFSNLMEASIEREARPKHKISALELVASTSDWVTPLKKGLFASDFDPKANLESVEFVEQPGVVVDDTGKVRIPYVINRHDISKDWIERELHFTGEITIEKQGNHINLEISSQHSSKETESINKRILSRASRILKDSGATKSDQEKRITFGSFSNIERVRFFKRLTAGLKPFFSLGSVHDMEIGRDKDCPELPTDPQVSWLNETVKRIRIDGERLNNIFLIQDETYYSYYYVLRMDITFPFTCGLNTGTCRVVFSFPFNLPPKSNIVRDEMELNVEETRIIHDSHVNSDAKKDIASRLHRAVREVIETEYNKIVSERAVATPSSTGSKPRPAPSSSSMGTTAKQKPSGPTSAPASSARRKPK